MTVPKELEAKLAGMPNRLDVPLRQLDDYDTARSALEARIRTIRSNESVVAELRPLMVELTKWRDQLVDWRKTLCDQLLALPERDLRAYGLRLSIMQVDRGLDFRNEGFPARIPLDDLMSAAGYEPDGKTLADTCGACWRGSLPYVEERLAELQRRHDDAQARLDGALRQDP